MKLTFVLSSLWLNGGNRVVVEFANHRAGIGDRVTLVVPGGSVDPQMRAHLSDQVKIKQTNVKLDGNRGFLKKLTIAAQLARLAPESDAVFATHSPTVLPVLMACRLLRRGKPVWLYQDSPGMFARGSVEEWIQNHALRFFSGTFTVTRRDDDLLKKRFPGRKIFFVGEGISDMQFFHPLEEEDRKHITGGIPTILTIGDTRARKGFADVLAAVQMAAQSTRNLVLWVVSKEDFQPQTSLQHRFFLRPGRAEFARLYAACDVFVLASWNESFGLPGLEAMACGAPAVIADSGGVQAYAVDGKNCLMAPVKSPEKLAEAIHRILTSPDLACTLRQAGPETARQFQWEDCFQRFDHSLTRLQGSG